MSSINNSLLDARFAAGLTLTEVAALLGADDADRFGMYERGTRVPTLRNAIALEILYQQPLAALFPELYTKLRAEIHTARAVARAAKARKRGGK